MEYRLYSYVGKIKEEEQSEDEGKIVKKLMRCVKKNSKEIDYIIILSTKTEDLIYRVIKSKEEYNEYINEYGKRERDKIKAKRLY